MKQVSPIFAALVVACGPGKSESPGLDPQVTQDSLSAQGATVAQAAMAPDDLAVAEDLETAKSGYANSERSRARSQSRYFPSPPRVVEWTSDFMVAIGQGWDTKSPLANKAMIPCYESDSQVARIPIGSAGLEAEFSDSMKFGYEERRLDLSFNVGWISATGGRNSLSKTTTKNTRTHFIVRTWNAPVREYPQNLKLSEHGKALASHGVEFLKQCGDSVVTSATRQAEAKVVYTIQATHEDKLREIKSNIKASLGQVGASLDVRELVRVVDKAATVEVSVSHTGRKSGIGLLIGALGNSPLDIDAAISSVAKSLGADSASSEVDAPIADFVLEDPAALFPEIRTDGWVAYSALVRRQQEWARLADSASDRAQKFTDTRTNSKFEGQPVKWCHECDGCSDASKEALNLSAKARVHARSCEQAVVACSSSCADDLEACPVVGGESYVSTPSIFSCLEPAEAMIRWVAHVNYSYYSFPEEQLYFGASIWPEFGVRSGVLDGELRLVLDDNTLTIDIAGLPTSTDSKGNVWYSLRHVAGYSIKNKSKHESGNWYCWGGTANRGCDARADNKVERLNVALGESGLSGRAAEVHYRSSGKGRVVSTGPLDASSLEVR